jgi:cell division protein FtsB
MNEEAPKKDRRFLRVRRPEKPFWEKAIKLALVGVIAISAFTIVFGNYGLLRMLELRKETRHLEEQIAYYKMKKKLLEMERDKLKSDAFTIEKHARERLGLYKPGEAVFLFLDADSAEITDAEGLSLDKSALSP